MRKTNNIWRKTIQWSIIALLATFALSATFVPSFSVDFEAYCPFGGLQALGSYLLNDALSCTMTGIQIVMGLTLLIATLLLSKLFCSFICPIGTISEWLSQLGQRFNIQITINKTIDLLLRSLKYILLFITLFYTLRSNELFCKKFDPYYGITSGFDSDVVLWWSLTAIGIVVFASLFFRLFWCKYLCPLGAISNLFKFTGFFAGTMILYLLLLKLGVEITYVWPLAIACIGGYTIELSGHYGRYFPAVKVTRNVESCTHCSLCSQKCPQGIDIAHLQTVKEADCHLCGDCVSACPVSNTLQFNHRNRLKYLPHIATIVLVLAGILLGQLWHIPTINQKWYDFSTFEDLRTYERSGLSSVKCFGSSTAFANRMREVNGVLGVASYVDTKTVKIYYDANQLDEEAIERAMFTAQKTILRKLKKEETRLTKVHVSLEDFFDKNDFNYLARFLQENTEAVALLSEYACPVMVDIFFPSSVAISEKEIIKLLETESFSYTHQEKEYIATMGYEVVDAPIVTKITTQDYYKALFIPIDYQFNNKSSYSPAVLKKFRIASPVNKQNRSRIKYLISHLSNNEGIVAFRNDLDSANNEYITITYVDTISSIKNITNALVSDTLYYNYKDGRQGKIMNMFDFAIEQTP